MFPKARKARDECIKAIELWREQAIQNTKSDVEVAEWDNWWGLKCMRLRNEVFKKFSEWDSHSCAAADMATLWAMNTNVAPAAFWFFFETLRSPELFREASLEVRHSCITGHPQSIVVKDLVNRPLLSSIYAEVLRKYVAIMMIRETQQATEFGEWNVPKGQRVVVCSYTEHMDPQHWNTGSPSDPHPVKEFWGKRFLVPDTTPPKFEISGRAGTWIPYGQGERMCPGRHFTKTQMLLTFAKLMAEFDFELKIPNISSWNPKLNMSHFGFGALPPGERIPFRVRRRTA